MGQYYLIVNLDKHQYLHPHHCGDGMKLLELATASQGTLACLAILLASGNGLGGGDLRSNNSIIGTWAGDRIVLAGDYEDTGAFTTAGGANLYDEVTADDSPYVDVSFHAMRALLDDPHIAQDMKARHASGDYLSGQHYAHWQHPPPLTLPHAPHPSTV